MERAELITPADLAGLIDHTLLRADATGVDVERLCREARDVRFAAVCVNPVWVALAARSLRGSAVRVCTVVSFPLGGGTTAAKVFEAREALARGASEVDMVINLGALKAGALDDVRSDVAAVVDACRRGGAIVKAIIETALLTDEEKATASRLAMEAGAAFVKTSTGFAARGATAADVALIRQAAGPAIGIKAAGGIRDLAAVRAMLEAGATRIGTSAGVQIVREAARARGSASER
jgi:deoxyribose-phosphate aldolase